VAREAATSRHPTLRPQEQVNAEIFGTAVYDRALFRIKEMPEDRVRPGGRPHPRGTGAYADANANPELALELRVRLREANIFTVRAARDAVGLIFEMAGSSAVYRGRPIERAFRDINTAVNTPTTWRPRTRRSVPIS
jgi:alkylation response protein AidB-like acyl-CoA dehydrogenase